MHAWLRERVWSVTSIDPPPPRGPRKWHESLASTVITFVFFTALVIVITSPCWGFALLLWVTK